MRYFRPDIELAAVLPLQTGPEEKLGGLPWGLPSDLWPDCAKCGKPQTLLAEFHHEPQRLDLGAAGRVLFVFHCAQDPGMCEDWDQNSGGNAAFILDGSSLSTGLTDPSGRAPIYPEARIQSWSECQDSVPATLQSSFFSRELYSALDEGTINSVTMGTKLGSVPAWIQDPGEAPSGYRFLGQLDSTYSFYRPLPPAASRVALEGGPDEEKFEGRTWWAQGPNFGDGGIGYLFLREQADRPDIKFFWQCL